MIGRQVIVVAVVIAMLGAGLLVYYEFSVVPLGCRAPTSSQVGKYQAQTIKFGAVTEYCLDNPTRWSNGIFVAQDGSVWFGEQAVPGLGHLFSNGTVVEYPWPGYQSSGSVSSGVLSSIWGVVAWNGRIWAADGDANKLIGFDPSDGSTESVNATGAPFPYLLAPAPDGTLWFTALSTKALLGRLGTDLSLKVFSVSGLGKEEPIQVIFVNDSRAYMVALDPSSPTGQGGLYSFDPQTPTGTIQASQVGGNFTLLDPDSLSLVGNQIWITQHYPSNVVEYDLRTGLWTLFPTSLVDFASTTLPYFVQATSTGVWFNEHYANRIAFIDPSAGTMTEFSEADPPITNETQLHNDLTIAAAPGGLWFTSATANYIGFVSGGQTEAFSLRTSTSNALSLSRNGSLTVHFQVTGSWNSQLKVQVSDSERITSVPDLITVQPGSSAIPAGSGPVDLGVTISANGSLAPGRYTVAVTLTDGLVYQTAFVFLTVT